MTLSVSQNGENGTTIRPDRGSVTITAIIDDTNQDDSFILEWNLQNLPGPVANEQTVTFDPSVMTSGNYPISVTVTDDGDPALSDSISISLTVRVDEPVETQESGGGGGDLLLLIFLALFTIFRSNIIRLISQLFRK